MGSKRNSKVPGTPVSMAIIDGEPGVRAELRRFDAKLAALDALIAEAEAAAKAGAPRE